MVGSELEREVDWINSNGEIGGQQKEGPVKWVGLVYREGNCACPRGNRVTEDQIHTPLVKNSFCDCL